MIDTIAPLVPWASLALAVAAWLAALPAILALRSAPGRQAGWPGRVAPVTIAVVASAAFVILTLPPRLTGRDLGLAEIVIVPDVAALTDCGQTIPVRRYAEPAAERSVPTGYEGRAILAGGEQALSNCHGWVFTGGRYAIAGENVDAILRDNGYARVAAPGLHDLIVYRDAAGRPVHTGVVKAVGADGFILVESKWGSLRVFWHTPDDQGYSPRYEYWHSDRGGHLLEIVRRGRDAGRPGTSTS
jgi:hypothetical protein